METASFRLERATPGDQRALSLPFASACVKGLRRSEGKPKRNKNREKQKPPRQRATLVRTRGEDLYEQGWSSNSP